MTRVEMEPGCECGSVDARILHSSRAPTGHRIRNMECKNCGARYTWAGGRIPVSFWMLDEEGMRLRRDWKRRRNGYRAQNLGRSASSAPAIELQMWVEVPKGLDKRRRTSKTGGPAAGD